MNGFLFLALALLLFQIMAALFAIGMGFLPPLFWWLFVPMLLCFVGWRLTRNRPAGYLKRNDR